MSDKEELIEFWKEKRLDGRLIDAFVKIPRENFVPPELMDNAYGDHPLPTIRNQSISQPTTIMVMMEALELKKGDKVFEIGAGAGYQAALISKVIGKEGQVISADVIPELVQFARTNIGNLGINNVSIIEGDGSEGVPKKAPFDKVIITAACPTIPQPVIDQLKEGGIVVAPVGDLESQTMIKGTKRGKGLDLQFLGSFCFVPMRGKHGFREVETFY